MKSIAQLAKEKPLKLAFLIIAVIILFLAVLSMVNRGQSWRSFGEERFSSSSGIAGSVMVKNVPMVNAPTRNSLQKIAAPEMAFTEEYAVAQDNSLPIIPPQPPTAGETAADTDQKIIKTGILSFEVEDISETVSRLNALAQEKGGFVQESSVFQVTDERKEGSVMLRVPSEKFEETMATAKKMAAVVRHESTNGQDVTEQYTDLQARLHNAQAQEQAYLALLSKATDVQDMLAVQRELSSVRGTIETLQGRIQYLENATSYSTIAISLSETPRIQVPTTTFRPWSAVKQAAQALVLTVQSLAVTTIWFLILGGGLALPIIVLVLGIWMIVRHKKNKKTRI